MSSRGSSPVEDHGNLFAEPDGYFKPPPQPSTQTYTTLTNHTITLHLVGANATEAHHLWNGSRVISDYFQAHPDTVHGKTVLELGAAAGLPSLVAATLGAEQVVMTDYPDADIVEVMQRNIDECALLEDGEKGRAIVAKGYIWGRDVAPLLAELPADRGGFDVLILADLLFRHTEHGHLLDTIRDALRKDSGSRGRAKAYVFFTSYRPWLRHKDLAFFDLARERGFVVEQILERKMDRVMFEDDPGDVEVLKTCTGWTIMWPEEEAGK